MVKAQSEPEARHSGAGPAVLLLGLVSVLIILSGAAFSISSVVYRTSFLVMNADIPGYIFGAVAVFLGLRYIKAIRALSFSIRNKGLKFSWKNFARTVN